MELAVPSTAGSLVGCLIVFCSRMQGACCIFNIRRTKALLIYQVTLYLQLYAVKQLHRKQTQHNVQPRQWESLRDHGGVNTATLGSDCASCQIRQWRSSCRCRQAQDARCKLCRWLWRQLAWHMGQSSHWQVRPTHRAEGL